MTSEKSLKPKTKICRTCIVIRMVVLAMLVLVITGLLARDKVQHLSFLTTWNVAIAIMIFGTLSFIVKYIFWKLENKNKSNDSLQND